MDDPGLRLERLEILLAETPLLAIDCLISPGEVLTVMGSSGAGKSTLLSAILGTIGPPFRMRGAIRLNGEDLGSLPPEKRRVGLLFQDDLLFPHLSVAGNLGFGLRDVPRARRRQEIESELAQLGLEGFADRDPATLSGGQKARVALGRMLLSRPRALLLDEPFSSLDANLRRQTRDLVFGRVKNMGLPCVLVTHDKADAEAAAGPIITLGASHPV